jgi:hypothetical protein
MVPRFSADAVNAHLAELFPPDTSSPQEQCTGEQDDVRPELLRNDLSPEVQAELTAVDAQRHDWIASIGRPNRAETRGTYQRIADLWVSTTDPDATLMRKRSGGVHLSYQTHYVVDGGKARIILAALVTPSEVMENLPMLDLVWRARFRWHLPLEQVTGDATYGTIENIVALEDAGIRAYISLPDFEKRTPFFGRSAFTYDAEHDHYSCPNGALLPRRKAKYTERAIIYQANAATCHSCPLKAQCTESDQGRQVRRNFDEAYLERVRSYHQTEAYQKAMRCQSSPASGSPSLLMMQSKHSYYTL